MELSLVILLCIFGWVCTLVFHEFGHALVWISKRKDVEIVYRYSRRQTPKYKLYTTGPIFENDEEKKTMLSMGILVGALPILCIGVINSFFFALYIPYAIAIYGDLKKLWAMR